MNKAAGQCIGPIAELLDSYQYALPRFRRTLRGPLLMTYETVAIDTLLA
jgi:hypothetical protein